MAGGAARQARVAAAGTGAYARAGPSDRGGDMGERPRMTLTATVLGAPDARELAAFYQRLLGWPVGQDEPGWVTLRPPGDGAGLSFQTEVDHARPTWPARPGDQQMKAHLDIEGNDLHAAGVHAVAAGGGR